LNRSPHRNVAALILGPSYLRNRAELCSRYVLITAHCRIGTVTTWSPSQTTCSPNVLGKSQAACKPGSVPLRGMTIPLGRPLPNASSDRPGQRIQEPILPASRHAASTWSCSRWGLSCRDRYRPRGALLPHPFTLASAEAAAVCFLRHFPWGCPRRALPGTVFPWSPDFPLSRRSPTAAIRPPGIAKVSCCG
jgi:hypothetical protein